MKCKHCGAEIEASARFCYKCGSATAENPATAENAATAENPAPAAPASAPAAPIDQSAYNAALAKAEALAAGKKQEEAAAPSSAPREAKSDKGFATYVAPAGQRIDAGGDAMRRDSFEGQGKASLWQRLKSLLAAMYESGRLQKLLLFAGIGVVLLFVLLYSIGTFSFGGKSPEAAGSKNGYTDYKQLVSAYIGYMENGDDVKALACYAPALTEYYAKDYSTNNDILWVCDDALQEGVYGSLERWEYGDTLGWDVSFYEDEFQKVGLKADSGMDAQVYFTWAEGGEQYTDYYVFEMVQADGRWFLVSVYY